MHTYLLTFSLSLLMAMGLTPLVVAVARRRRLVDQPNPRSIHTKAVARLGGVAIFGAAMLAIVPVLLVRNNIGDRFRELGVEIMALLGAATLMFAVGLYDDLKRIRIRTKLAGELSAALLVCAAGIHIQRISVQGLFSIDLGWVGCLITIIWIVGITNAVNLIDGLDGLAAGITAIACGVIAALAVVQGNVVLAVVMLALVGALAGFLVYNFHPARIFMGDCGSLFIGFTVAAAAVLTAAQSETLVGVGLPVLLPGSGLPPG